MKFTDPEVAQVGLRADNAPPPRARVAELALSEMDRALTADATAGLVKLVSGPRGVLRNLGGGRVLGATIAAEREGELIHEPALAMATGMFTGRLAATNNAYPPSSMAIQLAAAQFFSADGRTARTVTAVTEQTATRS